MRAAAAALARRLGAYAVDVAILAAVLIPTTFGLQTITGYRPDTGLGVWFASLLTISIPSWTYFILADASRAGATVGKRLVVLHTRTLRGERVPLPRAIARTAVKLLPWELTHAAMFALSVRFDTFTGVQIALLSVVYALAAGYLVVALRTRGQRSVHDLVAGTAVVPSV